MSSPPQPPTGVPTIFRPGIPVPTLFGRPDIRGVVPTRFLPTNPSLPERYRYTIRLEWRDAVTGEPAFRNCVLDADGQLRGTDYERAAESACPPPFLPGGRREDTLPGGRGVPEGAFELVSIRVQSLTYRGS